MSRVLRWIFGAGLVVAGVLVVGVSSAMASSSNQSQTVTATVPSSISLTGLSATASGTTPAGTNTFIDAGSITVSTNNGSGYTLSGAAGGPNFVGSGGHTFPISDDTLMTCTVEASNCSNRGVLTTTGTVLATTSAPSSDLIWLVDNINLPGQQAADVYSVTITYTATTNP